MNLKKANDKEVPELLQRNISAFLRCYRIVGWDSDFAFHEGIENDHDLNGLAYQMKSALWAHISARLRKSKFAKSLSVTSSEGINDPYHANMVGGFSGLIADRCRDVCGSGHRMTKYIRLTLGITGSGLVNKCMWAFIDLRPLTNHYGDLDKARNRIHDTHFLDPFRNRANPVEWEIRTRSREAHTFWGLWVPTGVLRIDLDCLANDNIDSVACLDSVFKQFGEACERLNQQS